jgi:MFS family permease
MTMAAAAGSAGARAMTGEEKKVIFASSLGTVFEWYDFYLYGWTAAQIGKAFYSAFDANTQFIFALLTFSAGFLVRPLGALVFGRIGDLVGRKYTFLVTISIMGLSTFLVGLTPGYQTIGWLAPTILIGLRLLQGLALGGEYGGAATYVAEHAPQGRRGFYTSWIQTTATIGLFLSLLVVYIVRNSMSADAFGDSSLSGGWRIPYLLSILLLGISIWIRMQLSESPLFQKMKDEGKGSKAPLSESFGNWQNGRIALIALLGLTAGQAVIWYGGQFYARVFLVNTLKVPANSADIALIIALAIATVGFLFFGWLSDKIGRKPIILAGCSHGFHHRRDCCGRRSRLPGQGR